MENDETIDRLLRRTAGARGDARPTGACLDAETLAAWTDGSLPAAQRAAAETHAADCDRCLGLLAAMARTSPPPSGAEPSSWFPIRWLVPLTTAAVALTAWVVIQSLPGRGPAVPPSTEGTPATEETLATREALATEETQKKHRELAAEPKRATEETQKQHRGERDARLENEALTKRESAPKASAPARNQAQGRRSSEPVAAAKPAPPVDAVTRAPSSRPLARADAADERRQFRAAAQVAPPVIPSPDPSVRWRLVGSSVERSTDGGGSWTPQPTGTTIDLVAGSSPARDVCWIVGRSGLVLLSTDGVTWRRLEFPATGDLVRVSAADATTSTVTTADGRTYRTTDAGRTWTLQENRAAPF